MESLIDGAESQIRNTLSENFKIQEQTLEIIINGVRYSEDNNLRGLKTIWNIAGFINIVSYDLKVVGQDLTFARNEWMKRHYARHASLLIFESINDLFDLLGKEFKEISKQINLVGLEDRLKKIRKLLNDFKNTHSGKLNIIRNAATAHRDNNILNQFTIIENISWQDTIALVADYDNILNKLAAIIMEIIQLGPEEFDK